MSECGDGRLPLWGTRGDRRSTHTEVFTLEVDVVQFVAVDEAPGGGVAYLGVVLPRIPQAPKDLGVVAGLGEQRVDDHRIEVARHQFRQGAASEESRIGGAAVDPQLHAGPAGADKVQCRNRFGDVEWFGVGGDRGREDTDRPCGRRDPIGDEHGVEPTPHAVGTSVRDERMITLQAESVVDGDEVERSGLGLAHQIRPVAGGEQFAGSRGRFPPRPRMPSGIGEGDGEVDVIRHEWPPWGDECDPHRGWPR